MLILCVSRNCTTRQWEHEHGRSRNKEKYLSNDLRRLGRIDRLDVLNHGAVIVSLLVQVVAEAAVDGRLLLLVHAGLLGQVDGQREHVALVEQLQPLLQRLLVVAVDLAVLGQDEQVAPDLEHGFQGRDEGFAVADDAQVRLEQDKRRGVEEGVGDVSETASNGVGRLDLVGGG